MGSTNEETKQDNLLDHNYDGIEELDNPAPGWLMAMLYGSIIFAVGYTVYYGFNMGPSLDSAYLQESKSLEKEWADYYAKHPIVPPTIDELREAAKDPTLLEAGKKQFATSCSPCHGKNGQGLIGPNLTDDHWLHGGKMTDVYGTVVKGVAGKGMPPWGRALTPDKLKGVVAYVRSMQGSSPSGAKAPEGTVVEPDPL
jgi:cytochrome c oxidase cbb3-type subunit 3